MFLFWFLQSLIYSNDELWYYIFFWNLLEPWHVPSRDYLVYKKNEAVPTFPLHVPQQNPGPQTHAIFSELYVPPERNLIPIIHSARLATWNENSMKSFVNFGTYKKVGSIPTLSFSQLFFCELSRHEDEKLRIELLGLRRDKFHSLRNTYWNIQDQFLSNLNRTQALRNWQKVGQDKQQLPALNFKFFRTGNTIRTDSWLEIFKNSAWPSLNSSLLRSYSSRRKGRSIQAT